MSVGDCFALLESSPKQKYHLCCIAVANPGPCESEGLENSMGVSSDADCENPRGLIRRL
jgi:hypothetical protein